MYFQLENLSRADPPFKSVAALNCVILGCANIWDLDRAYQTFEAISSTFGLNPNIHSYNALMSAFGKLRKVCQLSPSSFKPILFPWVTLQLSALSLMLFQIFMAADVRSYKGI